MPSSSSSSFLSLLPLPPGLLSRHQNEQNQTKMCSMNTQAASMDKPGSHSHAACKPMTTFVQTDPNTFREVVQRLTGPSSLKVVGAKRPTSTSTPTSTSKLHERRHLTRPKLQIVKPAGGGFHLKGSTEHASCPVGTPSKIMSKLSIGDQGEKEMEEEKAIKEKRFYLHPSPRSMPGEHAQPELLTLFPLESPKANQKP